jgi:hypothetical protein
LSEKEIEKLRAEMNAVYEGLSFILSRIDEIEKAAAGHIDAWNPTKIKWSPAEGPSGVYEKASKQESVDYQAMIDDLKAHQGRLMKEELFDWLFDDQETIGRKPRKKKPEGEAYLKGDIKLG